MSLTIAQQWSVFYETVAKKNDHVAADPELKAVVKQAIYFGVFFMLNTIEELSATHQTEEGLKAALEAYSKEVLDYAMVPAQDRRVQ